MKNMKIALYRLSWRIIPQLFFPPRENGYTVYEYIVRLFLTNPKMTTLTHSLRLLIRQVKMEPLDKRFAEINDVK